MFSVVGRLAVAAMTLWVSLTPAAARDSVPLRAGDTLLHHVTIVDTESGRIAADRSIIIRDGRIAAVEGRVAPKAGSRVIDGRGAFAIPGLWDSHVHIMQESEQASLDYAARLIGYGVTHVRDMGAIPEIRTAALARFQTPGADAPYVYSAGPTLWAFDSEYGDKRQRVVLTNPSDMNAAVDKLAAGGSDFIKVYAGFDRPKLTALAAAAARRKLPLAGHAQPGMALTEQVKLGMRTIEHVDFATFAECVSNSDGFFNRVIASRFMNSKEAIPAIYAEFAAKADTKQCSAGMRSAAAAGLVFTPTMGVVFMDKEEAERAAGRIPPQLRESCDLYRRQFVGLSPEQQGVLPAAGQRLLRIMADAGVPILAGSDAPTFCLAPGVALATELSLMTKLGLSPLTVLQAATRNPARTFGMRSSGVRIAAGEPADMVLLSKNPLADAKAYATPVGLYTQRRWRNASELAALRNR